MEGIGRSCTGFGRVECLERAYCLGRVGCVERMQGGGGERG